MEERKRYIDYENGIWNMSLDYWIKFLIGEEMFPERPVPIMIGCDMNIR